jgi:hypothetical protein
MRRAKVKCHRNGSRLVHRSAAAIILDGLDLGVMACAITWPKSRMSNQRAANRAGAEMLDQRRNLDAVTGC